MHDCLNWNFSFLPSFFLHFWVDTGLDIPLMRSQLILAGICLVAETAAFPFLPGWHWRSARDQIAKPVLIADRVFAEQNTSVSSQDEASVNAAVDDPPYWLKDIAHQGRASFNPNPSQYVVFRNVKDYGAKGNPLPRILLLQEHS